ncbi:ketoacyl-synt-domain-containing protein [Aspergillus sclerotioniger CBS 115572]|uniref:Ketoacyl-synt-domain-containing protein n=1 Tax=Aspergillus sclerotioniger CBS 115572 TaxID=1450535 RepID=A0A317W5M9_9EURO|nr:ketoacyl-synt-domain-containing protein [Aspergillus sclerotioniger CBS 115572]PWY79460.1 ketoacyl-synt-domain-containing protein [Aspergillus sclerotioniger CBS 115572]
MSFPEPIAIIGTGCRFPGSASSPTRLWDLLHHPRDVASKTPSDRFRHDTFYHPDGHHGRTKAPESYFLTEDIRAFDAPFFNVSRAEAESMDPQQRLLLEVVYESLETAGLQMEGLRGSDTAVFCGLMNTDYGNLASCDWDEIPTYTPSGTASSMLANRVSFFFDWHGPSMTIDTACSSSLVALHQGVGALRNGDCHLAVIAASNLILSPREYIAASKMHLLSPTGRCRMWDENADGFARGEGIASVVLKRLGEAIADGDPIESIIRATGVNADGRSMGITMPSSMAQSQLIRSTYAIIGLSPTARPEDRCQFFEAHGTGTQAGDPQEATAIYKALFGIPVPPDKSSEDWLYVGSIKTVIGHTEGVAGLAGVIKASLSVQKGIIPPNMFLDRINPVIEPLTSRLRVPTEPMPWPSLAPGVPRRVSVNSFGFGGSNAHAIIENYTPGTNLVLGHTLSPQILPFTFSASTEQALTGVLEHYGAFLQNNFDVDLVSLAESLLKRRSALSHRIALTAASIEDLQSMVQIEIEKRRSATASPAIVSRSSDTPRRVLGIFTGQGAQYPQMFWDQISASPQALAWMAELQASLDSLPSQYRPNFSMIQELSAPESSSRLHEAVISQPLRTAIQIIQVNFLRALNVSFSAVVGHSSGEIAAAYAAGAITASDAIRLAYLRGLMTKHAGANGQPGAMLASGIPWEEAHALCDEGFSGKVRVAASNSPVSVTFSGDVDAVQELEWMLKSLDLSVHRLRVDVAYHSHHVVPCAAPYRHALEVCGIRVHPVMTKWFSSVYKDKELHEEDLSPQYWGQNMLRPVLFSQAVAAAFTDEPEIGLVVEVGAHPTLKGPILQTLSVIKDAKSEVAYLGLGERGSNNLEVFSRAIGFFWAYLGPNIDIHGYLSLFDRSYGSRFLKNLPTYPFDHSRSYWKLSRLTNARLHCIDPPHPLLGTPSPETGGNEWRWRNHLSRAELKWLNDHQIQSQVVFPATGYIVMALEAAAIMARGLSLRLVELDDVLINRAILIPDDPCGVETIFKVELIERKGDIVFAAFQCYASLAGSLKACASGKLTVLFGEQDPLLLPPKSSLVTTSRPVNVDAFYACLGRLGLGYSGPFRGLKALTRRVEGSMGIVSGTDPTSSLLLHPATMDSSLQALLAARSFEELRALQVPVSIDHVAINTLLCKHDSRGTKNELDIETFLYDVNPDGMTGDINAFNLDGLGIYQIEGLHVAPITSAEDRAIFSKIIWGPLLPQVNPNNIYQDSRIQEELHLAERCALLYMRDAQQHLVSEECEHLDWHRSRIIAWMDHVLSTTREGTHPVCRPEWLVGTVADVMDMAPAASNAWSSLRLAGENLPSFIKGMSVSDQESNRDGGLNDPFDVNFSNSQLAVFIGQIAFRFPQMKILQINAGSGSATKPIMNEIKRSYHSYIFTDVSPASFAAAQEAFSGHKDQFSCQVLDIRSDPCHQGFKEHSYDLVVAAGIMCNHRELVQALTNIRRLLKPGGYLVVHAATNTNINRLALIASFEKWWYDEEGHPQSPAISLQKWETLLETTGFGGFEAVSPAGQLESGSTFVTQAIDSRIQLFRDPCKFLGVLPANLLLIGGTTEATADLVQSLKALLAPRFRRLVVATALDALNVEDLFGWCALNLADLDSPCYEDITDKCLSGLKMLMNSASRLLWVTAGSESRQPYWGMSKAMIHCVAYENPQSIFQYLNVPDHEEITAPTLATIFMRLAHTLMDNDHDLDTCVDSTEFELQLVNGTLNIPRVHFDDIKNQRYSASYHVVKGLVVLQHSTVQVIAPSGKRCEFILGERQKYEQDAKEPQVTYRPLTSRFSTTTAFKIDGAGFLHLIVGRDEKDKTRWLALSDQHASAITAPPEWCWQVSDRVGEDLEPILLMRTAAALLAIQIVDKVRSNTSVLVYGADTLCKAVCDALSAFALARNIRVCFSTSAQSTPPKKDMLFIHERSSSRTLSRLLPDNLSAITGSRATCGVYNRIKTLMSEDVVQIDIASIGRVSSNLLASPDSTTAGQTFLAACGFALQTFTSQEEVSLIPVQRLQGTFPGANQLEIVDWTQSGQVPVRIQTASSMITFSAHKTYLLAGMTGDLGRSICQWMVSRGARSVVLGSRSPHVDVQWIEEMARLGARVVPMAMDVTNRGSICRAYAAICSELPSVGGVVNGAMVLKDCLFAQMTLEDMQSVVAPKVQGSIILNEVFGNLDLEFFILLGSAAGPLGNVGQTAYSAATEFMSALIQQRREQGLVGSIIHPGLIKGVGYFERADSARQGAIERNTVTPHLTEQDLYELFAEGILAGHPDSGRDPEVIAGYTLIDTAENPNALWLRNPKAWNLIKHTAHPATPASSSNDSVPIMIQLESAESMAGVVEVIVNGFIKEVRSKLQLSTEESLTGATVLTDMGVDSLVAIELRHWFVKELSVDLPVLQIIGGVSIQELSSCAASKLSADHIPSIIIQQTAPGS